jgi:hypothetical protein
MTKSLKYTVISLIIAISAIVYFIFNNNPSESDISECINNILNNSKNHSLVIITKNRGNTPILKGKATLIEKNNIIELVKKKCRSIEIQDFVEIIKQIPINLPSINFKIDHVNNIIIINSLVNNQVDANNILDSFNNAFINQNIPFTIKHDIQTNDKINPSEFDVYITLLIPSISAVRMTDITIKGNQIIVKGLVRDKLREKETIDMLTELFADELIIINQLELVIQAPVMDKYKYELSPLPNIKDQ